MVDLPLNTERNWTHQSRSFLTMGDNSDLWEACLSMLIWLKILRRKTRLPFTTLAAHDSRPATDCSCRFVARLRLRKPLSSSRRVLNLSSGRQRLILSESSSMPRKVITLVGSTTLPQWIENPSFLRRWISAASA